MPASENETFLTEDEVVARWREALTAGTLRNWRSKGQGPPYVHIGKAVLYARADLEAWEAKKRITPSNPTEDPGDAGSAVPPPVRPREGV